MSLAHLLGENNFLKLLPSNKILCDVTGHEMSARFDVVNAHINGKKFKKAFEWYSYDFSEFEPYIIKNKENEKYLYCTITNQSLNRIPDEVKKHINGKRFLRFLTCNNIY